MTILHLAERVGQLKISSKKGTFKTTPFQETWNKLFCFDEKICNKSGIRALVRSVYTLRELERSQPGQHAQAPIGYTLDE